MSDEEESQVNANEEKEEDLAFFDQKFDDDDGGIDLEEVEPEHKFDFELEDDLPEHMRGNMVFEEDDHLETLKKAIAKAKPVSETDHPDAYQEALWGIEYEEEDLKEEFWKTRWLSPATGVSATFRFNNTFRGGNATASNAKLTSTAALQDLGSAIPLYFQFSKIMSWCFIWMFILSWPALFFSFIGSRVPLQDQDRLGIYMFSIGNIGYNSESPSYAEDSFCSGNGTLGITEALYAYSSGMINLPTFDSNITGLPVNTTSNATVTCIHAFDLIEVTQPEVSFVLTVAEAMQVLVFMTGVLILHKHTHKVRDKMEILASSEMGLTDYSIMVSNLPADVTEEALIAHFSDLYALDTIDFRFRPPLDEAAPVQHEDHSPKCLGTWVADCTIYRQIGAYFAAFRAKQELMEKLYRSRAEMKMWAPDTTLVNGLTGNTAANPKKYQKAEKSMLKAAVAVEKFSQQFDKQMGKKLHVEFTDLEAGGARRGGSNKKKSGAGYVSESEKREHEEMLKPKIIFPDADISKPGVCAFITFEYAESMARCVEDYQKYSTFPFNLCYPRKMKFHGRKLHVTQAPKPRDVVWENLEAGWFKKTVRRGGTILLCVALVAVCFAVVLQAAIFKQSFEDEVPDLELCDVEIPALYARSYTSAAIGNVTLLRPETAEQKALFDETCIDVLPGSFYARFSLNNDFDQPVGNYSVSACHNDTTGTEVDVCPDPSTPLTCPCVLASASAAQMNPCQSLKCYKDADYSVTNDDFAQDSSIEPCSSFDAYAIGSCYCVSSLDALISESGGFLDTVASVREEASSSGSVCATFFLNYSLGLTLAYVAVMVIVIINQLLISSLGYLSRFECHISGEDEQSALFMKIFIALFLNIGVVIIIAFGNLATVPDALEAFSIFTGPYGDFTIQWYGAIGQLFILVVIIQSIVPYCSTCWDFHCTKSKARRVDAVKVDSNVSSKYPYQHLFDMVEVGPCFSAAGQSAIILSLIFVGMAYSPGLPLMSFILMMICRNFYYTDRKMICKYYQNCFKYGDAVMRLVVKFLPYAALLRLAMACWMFTTPNILYNSSFVIFQSDKSTGNEFTGTPLMFIKAFNRLNTTNGKPFLIIFIIIVIVKMLRFCWRMLPFYWALKIMRFIHKRICGKRSALVRPDANGYIHSYDLSQMEHPLRREQAPFSGDYFKYEPLRSPYNANDPIHPVITGNCCGCCCKKSSIGLSDDEIVDGWEYAELDTHCIKVIPWRTTIAIGDVMRHAGERKRTYEVINQIGGISSYRLDRIPAHCMSMIGFKDGTANMIHFQAARRKDYHKPGSIRNLLYLVDKHENIVEPYHKAHAQIAQAAKEASNWGLNVVELASTTTGKKKKKKTKEEKEAEANDAEGLYGEEKAIEEENQATKLARMLKNGYESEESSDDSSEESNPSEQFRMTGDVDGSDSEASDTSDEMALF